MKTVLLTEPVHDDGIALLRARADIAVVIAEGLPREEFRAALADATAIGVRTFHLGADLLEAAPSLRLVSKHGIGCDNIAVDHLTARGIPVTITADANAGAVAEHTMMLMLATAKNLLTYDRRLRGGDWTFRRTPISGELAGRSVLVVGFGRIGRRVADLCRAFGMEVTAFDPFLPAASIAETGNAVAIDLDDALPQADFVALHVPSSPATVGLFDAKRLGHMKAGAVLVNCSRGGIVDEAALVALLRSGHLAAAGVDVFQDEPPAPDNPLFALDNIVVTPHSAALTREGARKMALGMAQNILDLLDGRLDRRAVVNNKDLPDVAFSRP